MRCFVFYSFTNKSIKFVLPVFFYCEGTILIHSLTGGTGSGLGSRLLEEIRDAFPMAHVVSVAIAPHVSGDSPLQHYNSLLSLASLQRYILFHYFSFFVTVDISS